jgi:hypothetical protein
MENCILSHMHDEGFWSQLMDFIHRSLSPGRLYGALIQPRSEKGPVSLGPLVQLQTNTTEEWLRNHFEPILIKNEDDYDEEFTLDTKIKFIDLGSISQGSRGPSYTPTSATKKAILKLPLLLKS